MRAPRATAGGSGNEPPPGFRAGDRIMCRVVEPEPGGYSVTILKTNQNGFVKTKAVLEPGVDVLAEFVCIYKYKVLVTLVFGGPRD